ncbi:MAG: hypothetical protein KAY91_00415 [Rhodocyclaceae bacterium]|nr:hypothetical protein [Rhodocyclaceae bacterium]
MSDKTKLNELAALAGDWRKLALQMWPLLSANKQKQLKTQLTKSPEDPLLEYFKDACAIKFGMPKTGRPSKYNTFAMLWVWLALEAMKRLDIGNSQIDRLKKVVCYVTDPKNQNIPGLPQSLKDRLRDLDPKTAVPQVDLCALAEGRQKQHTAIETYGKHLTKFTPYFKSMCGKYSRSDPKSHWEESLDANLESRMAETDYSAIKHLFSEPYRSDD